MYDIDDLKAVFCKPRIHGNGFLQFDSKLTEDVRLNIWGHPDIPKQKTSTQIHNHRFSYRSKIIVGDLVHITYDTHEPDFDVGEDYEYDVFDCINSKGENTNLVFSGKEVCIHETSRRVFLPDDVYGLSAGIYHEVVPVEPSATLMQKTKVFDLTPSVLVECGKEPDNGFDRHSFKEEELWQIAKEVLKI